MTPTRREFLKTSLGASTLVSLGAAVPGFLARSALAAGPGGDSGDRILVVVQLAGGNDGLNTVVPYADDEYVRSRPTLRLTASRVHRIDRQLGFHPEMGAFMKLYEEGRLSVLQGVGYPNPSGDHFRSMQNWQSARIARTTCQTGWLGRAVDSAASCDGARVPALFVGQIRRPFTLSSAREVVPSIRSLEDYILRDASAPSGQRSLRQHFTELAARPRSHRSDADDVEDPNPLLGFLQRSSLAAYANSEQVEEVIHAVPRHASPARFQLARQLRTVAQLIRAELGIRIFYTELGGDEPGGFDTHANQAGNHAALLRHLSESVAAFVGELKRDGLLDRVLLMTFSEFGRTVAENGRRGTGHGSAAPLFLAGGRLRGGLVGSHPELTDLENGGQKFHTDFRRVYATVLDRWLGLDSEVVLGKRFRPLEVLRV